MGGLTVENNFSILKIEKRNKIIVFDLFLSRDFAYFILFLTMAVHCSSNVILLAIEYFIDSKGERQNIKLLSTQNNYSPSFGLKKLIIFFISSDKTDKKTLAELEVQNTLPNEGAWRLKLKKIQRI